jgi:hypothetical protein
MELSNIVLATRTASHHQLQTALSRQDVGKASEPTLFHGSHSSQHGMRVIGHTITNCSKVCFTKHFSQTSDLR